MEKVYCCKCRYCDDDYDRQSLYKCYHPSIIKQNFYGDYYTSVYCEDKNKYNDCKDFTLPKYVIRKQKRKERINLILNTIKIKSCELFKKVINRFGVTKWKFPSVEARPSARAARALIL